MNSKKISILAVGALFLVFGAGLALGAFEIINPGERGVVVRLGNVQSAPMGEGLNFKIPYVDSVETWDVKVQKLQLKSDASSADLQSVHTLIAINYRVNASMTPKIRQVIGTEYRDTVVEPAIQESVKAVTAKYQAEQLLIKRAQVRSDMEKTLQVKLDNILKGAFIVDAFNIEDFKFDGAFNNAIEDKQVAEQEAKKARNQVEQARAEADKDIQKARGRAESLRLEADARADATRIEAAARAEAITVEAKALKQNPDILKLRSIERWDGKMPTVMGGDSGSFILPLNNLTGNN